MTSHQNKKTPISTSAPRTISSIVLTRNTELICGLQSASIHDITDLPKPLGDFVNWVNSSQLFRTSEPKGREIKQIGAELNG